MTEAITALFKIPTTDLHNPTPVFPIERSLQPQDGTCTPELSYCKQLERTPNQNDQHPSIRRRNTSKEQSKREEKDITRPVTPYSGERNNYATRGSEGGHGLLRR